MPDSVSSSPIDAATAALVPAAGSGRRFGAESNKLFAKLGGFPLWYHSVARLRAQREIGRIVLIVSETDLARFRGEFAPLIGGLSVELAVGGDERTDSVRAGLDAIGDDASIQLVAVHDAARPLVGDGDIQAVVAAAWEGGAAILASPVSGTLKRGSLAADHWRSRAFPASGRPGSAHPVAAALIPVC